jgi:hypothetical protein
MPYHSHDDMPYHSHDEMPYHSHDDMPYHSHDEMPYHSHDDMPYHSHDEMPYHSHDEMPYHSHDEMPYHSHELRLQAAGRRSSPPTLSAGKARIHFGTQGGGGEKCQARLVQGKQGACAVSLLPSPEACFRDWNTRVVCKEASLTCAVCPGPLLSYGLGACLAAADQVLFHPSHVQLESVKENFSFVLGSCRSSDHQYACRSYGDACRSYQKQLSVSRTRCSSPANSAEDAQPHQAFSTSCRVCQSPLKAAWSHCPCCATAAHAASTSPPSPSFFERGYSA